MVIRIFLISTFVVIKSEVDCYKNEMKLPLCGKECQKETDAVYRFNNPLYPKSIVCP